MKKQKSLHGMGWAVQQRLLAQAGPAEQVGGQWASVQVLREVWWWQRTKVSPESPRWSSRGSSFTPAALGSREMHFPRKQLWAVNPGDPALLCCFTLSINLEIQVVYGSFLHKAGSRVWGSWAECKAAEGADLSRAYVHNSLSQHYWSSSFCSHIMWSSWHFYFVLSLPGKLSFKSLSCCNQLPWVTAGRAPRGRIAHDLYSGLTWRSQICACCHHSCAAAAATSIQHCCLQHTKRDLSGRIQWGLIWADSNILVRLRGCFASKIPVEETCYSFHYMCNQLSCFYFQQAAPHCQPSTAEQSLPLPRATAAKLPREEPRTGWPWKWNCFITPQAWRAPSKARCGEEGPCLWESLAAAY